MARTISRRNRNIVAISIAAALTLTGEGVAFAYWSSTGVGTGAATTGESVEFAITSDPLLTTGEITPDGPGQTVHFEVTNPGEGTQNLSENIGIAQAGTADAPFRSGVLRLEVRKNLRLIVRTTMMMIQ